MVSGILAILTAFVIATAGFQGELIDPYVERCAPDIPPNAMTFREEFQACLDSSLPVGHPHEGIQDQYVHLAVNYLTWPPVSIAVACCIALAIVAQIYVSNDYWRPATTGLGE